MSITDCICSKGYWRPDGMSGAACIRCPEGALCEGGPQETTFPYSNIGYWAKVADSGVIPVHHATGDDVNLVTLPLAGLPLPSNSSNPFDAYFELPQIFFECSDSCLQNSTCRDSNSGPICSSCADGYYNFFDDCLKCFEGSNGVAFTVFAWIVVIFIWNILQMAADKYQTMNTMLEYMQCLSIVQGFAVPWPAGLQGIITFFSIADFDIDVVSPQCIMQWNHMHGSIFTFLLPFIFFAFSGMHVLIAFLWSVTIARRQIFGFRLPFMVAELERVHELAHKSFASWLTILVILYNVLCQRCFEAFVCDTLPDGTSVLVADPSIECNSAEHQGLLGFAIISLILYIVGIPTHFLWKLYTLRKNDKLKDKQALKTYGFLYLAYKPGMWGWQVFMLFRRFSLCFLMVFFQPWPHYQLGLGLVLIILSICLQYHYLPCMLEGMNFLDCMALLSISFYMVSGFAFISEEPISDTAEEAIVTGLLLITTSTLGISGILFHAQPHCIVLVADFEVVKWRDKG